MKLSQFIINYPSASMKFSPIPEYLNLHMYINTGCCFSSKLKGKHPKRKQFRSLDSPPDTSSEEVQNGESSRQRIPSAPAWY